MYKISFFFFFFEKIYMLNVNYEEIYLNMHGGQKNYSIKNVSM